MDKIILTLDSRMHIFMQSVHIEVQERSTTFRQTLTEFGVLPAAGIAEASAPPKPKSGESSEGILGMSDLLK